MTNNVYKEFSLVNKDNIVSSFETIEKATLDLDGEVFDVTETIKTNMLGVKFEKKQHLLFATSKKLCKLYQLNVFYNNRSNPLLFAGSFMFEGEELFIR